MKQLKDNTACKYCYGCNKLELEDFNGVKYCKGFLPAYIDWHKRYYKALKEENDDGMQAQKSRR